MIGFYDYTVVLTYLSLVSAGLGIFISLHGDGHPYIGVFFLLFCGLCDAFDGKVARTKKDRTEEECKFGIQIDSLSDLVAFGVLPACIGEAVLIQSIKYPDKVVRDTGNPQDIVAPIIFFLILMLYVLVAMIRLAYFNVMEEKRQKEEGGVRKYYEGLPVTSAALIFPAIMLFQFMTPGDMTLLYFIGMAVTGCLFVSKLKVKKPTMKGILICIGIGAVEFAILLLLRFL
ncbi:MAG: CDP-alcohol phosphatidyltransferase family protein [Lachnospiraceae bacterium]|nr:CDP-alcohol phosphatidyltransferase family protein [Lachnospiraceae bacterium]MCR4685512.1 CDP-alcohol phosphatidyltransferase family protein [Lachnospiraceae bacterium]